MPVIMLVQHILVTFGDVIDLTQNSVSMKSRIWPFSEKFEFFNFQRSSNLVNFEYFGAGESIIDFI